MCIASYLASGRDETRLPRPASLRSTPTDTPRRPGSACRRLYQLRGMGPHRFSTRHARAPRATAYERPLTAITATRCDGASGDRLGHVAPRPNQTPGGSGVIALSGRQRPWTTRRILPRTARLDEFRHWGRRRADGRRRCRLARPAAAARHIESSARTLTPCTGLDSGSSDATRAVGGERREQGCRLVSEGAVDERHLVRAGRIVRVDLRRLGVRMTEELLYGS